MKLKVFLLSIILAGVSALNLNAQITVLSGPEEASNYKIAEDINKILGAGGKALIVNKKSNGVAENFQELTDPDNPVKVAFMQLDYLTFMKAQDLKQKTNKTASLKVIIPLSIEEIHFLTKKSSGLKKLSDLDTTTIVAIGGIKSGTYATAQWIKDGSKIYWKSRNLNFNDAIKALAFDEVQVMAFVSSAPIPLIDLQPLMIKPDNMPTLIEMENIGGWANYYEPVTFTPAMYQWLDQSISGFGVRTVLVVNEAKVTPAERESIQQLGSQIKSGLTKLREKGHPAWNTVDFSKWDPKSWPMY
jgi:TRAP-type uncharacterized transport system substrate-binding protein